MIELSTPLEQVVFVSVDVETTGLDPRHDQIVELGAVKVLNGEVVGEFDTLVTIDRSMPPDARRIHGITDDMLLGKPCIDAALSMLWTFVGDGALVEHSHKAFDIAFLEQAHGSRLNAVCINTCTLSRRLFPFIPRHSLAECCRRFGIENPQSHRALSDARATAHLLTRLIQACRSRYPKLEDLIHVAAVER